MVPLFGISKLPVRVPHQWLTWTHLGRFLAAKVVKESTACQLKAAMIVTQKMGHISLNKTALGTPHWHQIMLNFIDMLKCKDVAKKRTEFKVRGILFTCLTT